MANLQERNGWFHLQFRYQGRQFSHALGTQERKEAEAIRGSVDRALIRIKNRELLPPGAQDDVVAFLLAGGKAVEAAAPVKAPLTAKELRDQYLQAHANGALETNSLATVRLHLNHVLHHLGDRFVIRDLKNQQLQDYLDKRARRRGTKSRRLSPTTLKKEIASLRVAWNWGTRTGLLEGHFPGRGLTYPKTDEKEPFQTREEIERRIARGGLDARQAQGLWECLFLTKPEIAEFLDYVSKNAYQPFLYPMVAFAAHTGARRSELLRILIDDVDLEGGTALIREKKRVKGKRSTRRVPVSPFLKGVLQDWLKVHPGGQFMFTQQPEVCRSKTRGRGRPVALGALSHDEAHDHFQRVIKDSKWDKMKGWHVLRHSFISICAADGVDQRMLQQWVGHLSEETHRRYLHLIPSKEQHAIASVFQ
jgi:integrase